jgi:2-deoxy-D-gluconate 3-dehydrogenase
MTDWGPFSVNGKTAIVTGGAMGIGFGIAQRLLEGGANVLIADLDAGAGAGAVERLASGRPAGAAGQARALAVDVAADGAGERIVAACVEAFGRVDILVNDAGIFPQVPVLQMTPDLFDRVYRINLRGLAFSSKAAALQMIKQGGGGKIVNIGSVDSFHPSMIGLAAYDASKGGVWMFTKSLALEVAKHGIGVNMIAPGGVTTEGTSRPMEGSGMTAEQMRQLQQRFIDTKIPLARMGAPDDIAKVAVFLSSSASDYMTGGVIVVDGGMLLS